MKRKYTHPLDQNHSYKVRSSTKLGRIKRAILQIKSRAKRKELDFDLDHTKMTWPDICPVLGIKLNYFASSVQDNSVSVDRIDPSKGYTIDNCEVMSNRANRLKSDGRIEEFELLLKYLRKD